MGVLVVIDDVSCRKEITTGRDVGLAGWVVLSEPISDVHRTMLPPTFVEGNPLHDGGVVVQSVDHEFEFGHELLVWGVGPGRFGRIGGETRPRGIIAAFCADLVLPNKHAHAVAVIVVTAGFDLDVFADGVEAGVLQELDVGKHGGFGRRGEEAVGPPTLIKGSPMEERLPVEVETEMAILVLGDGGFTDAKVGLDLVALVRSLFFNTQMKIVKKWFFGRPKFWVFKAKSDLVSCCHRLSGDYFPFVFNGNSD